MFAPPRRCQYKFLHGRRGKMIYAEFSRRLGLPPSTLHRDENGDQNITLRGAPTNHAPTEMQLVRHFQELNCQRELQVAVCLRRLDTARRLQYVRQSHRQDACPPLTAFAAQITINNEYPVPARGGNFISKPNRKERKTKANRAVESSRNDRATYLARWFQDRHRSRKKSWLIFVQRRVRQAAH
jgi:hypothetical protein